MTEQTLQLDIPLLLPEIDDGRDACVNKLEMMLAGRRGISRVHVREGTDPVQLCLHFDPNLISLAAVERLAHRAGSEFTGRYRHETIPFNALTAADSAAELAETLEELPGVLHASINYAAGLAFVAYDTEVIQRLAINQTMRSVGYWPESEAAAEEMGPTSLPDRLRERWPTLLIGLAGLFFLLGWTGATFLNLPEKVIVSLYLLAYAAGGFEIARHALPGLFRGRLDTDVLMLAAAAGAAVLGEWAEGAFLLVLFGLGHAGEHYALDRARRAVSALGALMPKTAWIRVEGRLVERPVEALRLGDTIVVRPGDRVPADGVITAGQSTLDQSAITGESVPVEKGVEDEVFAGTVNHENALDVRVTRTTEDNTLSRVMSLVAEAQAQHSPTQLGVRRFTARFVPAVLLLVLLVIVVPPLVGWMPLEQSFYRAMLLLVAASPCALAIGPPAATLAGIAQAARNGVLIKGGVHLENLGRVRAMAFDKTGTLTEGRFRVTDVAALDGAKPDEALRLAAAVEGASNHPLARAVVRLADEKGLDLPAADGLENFAGRGVRSQVDGRPVLVGSLALFQEMDGHRPAPEVVAMVGDYEAAGQTTMLVNHGGRFIGLFALADVPRPGIRETLSALAALGVEHLVMLTGDNADVAHQVAGQVGVTEVRAGLLPDEKLAAVKDLAAEYELVAMIGDGVNDAPALAEATVGIAMGGAGTAVALETADVALMADDLGRLPFAVGLGRASQAIVHQNLTLALGVIGLLILTSVLGLLPLSGAVILHEGSTLLVVANALRLLRYGGG